ncbi:E3 ubiquitin-protein ligase TRIM21-like isoform X1 [Sander lucioperca]|uniref:E3 ubiquitin-protein ligase TRIM21-like isoform X1 n=1 Tax=Sander lucioperca TaxID=283035 RepID=UPI0016534604|nr:E3 ubiquitin-protein ligase TRIM21-like isoform X1 [Sander lucioperca]
MSAVSCLLTEDQFLCSICLDVFTDPVTIPCGHNFCKTCITEHWDINVPCQCPNCKGVFNMKPELQVNTFISEMAAQFRQSAQQEASSSSTYSGLKKKTWLFLLVCLMCVFISWMVSEQKKHDFVALKEEYEEKKIEQWKTGPEILQMIQKEIKHSMELSKEDTDRQILTAVKESFERSQAELIETIKEKQKTTEKLAEGFNNDVKQEISELKKRSTEVEQFYKAQLEKLSEQIMKLLPESDLKRVQQYEVDVTLDPDTAHPRLILSDDRKQVHDSDVRKNLPDNPERYETHVFVLAKQSFSSRRFYYEVQVKGKTAWLFGAARESINRKGKITLRPQDGYWTIWLGNDNEYYALDDPAVHLSLKSRPQKVGVFVDYEEGLVSFYDVDAEALIYSFTGCSFTEKLYPFFSPCLNDGGKNSAPLIISPVSH